MKAYTLKIRSGVEIDSTGRKAGKGALIAEDISNQEITYDKQATLGVNCGMSTGRNDVIEPTGDEVYTLDEKMGNTYIHEDLANTLNARDYKQPQMVAYGISSYESNAMKSDNPHSGIYEADTSRTLDLNGGNPACNQGGICIVQAYDIGEARLRNPQEYVEKAPTLTARCGTGGNNVPAVVYEKTENDE